MGGDLWQLPGCKKSERNTCENSLHHLRTAAGSFPVWFVVVICKYYIISLEFIDRTDRTTLFFNFFFPSLLFFDDLINPFPGTVPLGTLWG